MKAITRRRAASSRRCSTIRKCGCSACAGSISKPSGSATARQRATMPDAPPRPRHILPGLPMRQSRSGPSQGDWDGALKLVESQKATRQIEREAANRRRAVLLTAKAKALFDTDPGRLPQCSARGQQAVAGLCAGCGCCCQGAVQAQRPAQGRQDPRGGMAGGRASGCRRSLRSCAARRCRQRSAGAGPQAAVDEAEQRRNRRCWWRARRSRRAITRRRAKRPKSAARMQPREGAFLLLADIEEAESGDQGRVRQYLSKAVRAPRDPAWVADGFVSDEWAPVSPVTGRIDAFEWRSPVERLGQLIEPGCRFTEPTSRDRADTGERREGRRRGGRYPRRRGSGAGIRARPSRNPRQPRRLLIPPTPTVRYDQAVESEGETPPSPDDPGVDPEDATDKESRRFRLF